VYDNTELKKCPNCYSGIDVPTPEPVKQMRFDRSFMERICVHGVGHPDPDSAGADPLHACDGCCTNETP
jgi:hypothetical protein